MKKLLPILIVSILIASCQQQIEQPATAQEEIQTARPSRDVFYHVGVKSASTVFPAVTDNFKGVAFEVNVEELKLQGDYTKSCWIAFQYQYLLNGVMQRDWVQWGWYNLGRGVEQAFYVYHMSPLSGQISPLDVHPVNSNVPLQSGTIVRFEIKNIEGTTRWEFSRNGQVVFDVDLHSEVGGNFPAQVSSSNSIELFTESRGGSTFSTILHINYMEYYKNGVWAKVPSARTSGSGWNIVGRIKNPSFQPSEFEIGGRGIIESGTLVW